MRKILTLILPVVMFLSAPVYAQGQPENVEDVLEQGAAPVGDVNARAIKGEEDLMQKSADSAKAENSDKAILDKKMVLAKKMHEIRPTRSQIDAAVKRAAGMLPENERGPFINVMSSMLNYNAIERISMDAMIETYTLKELEVMVDFYSQPEALTASMKMGLWAQKVQPEIVRMIDKAILRIRTGE